MKSSYFFSVVAAAALTLIAALSAQAMSAAGANVPSIHIYSYTGHNINAFSKKFCRVRPNAPMIFVASASLFKNHNKHAMKCRNGTYHIRYTADRTDPGHALFNVDAPAQQKNAFDCDGKADIGMKTVAINCFMVSKETVDHKY